MDKQPLSEAEKDARAVIIGERVVKGGIVIAVLVLLYLNLTGG